MCHQRLYIVLFLFVAALTDVTDGADVAPRQPWTTSKLQGQPTAPHPYRVELAFPNLRFDNPTSVTEIPNTKHLLVTQMNGKMFAFGKDRETTAPSLVGDLSKIADGGVGLYHAIFHPKYPEVRYLFACLSHPAGHARLTRFHVTDSPDPQVIPDSEHVILTWPTGGHGGGCLAFSPDEYLYISTGDGSGPSPPDGLTTGQDVSDLLGAVLRIDVNRASGDAAYSVPPDNPFVGRENVRPEIWSYGLRNPWKFGIDPENGNVFVADNGWESWEMVHKLHRGSNCGWPIMEGRVRLRGDVQPGPTPITPPIQDHPHTEANSVIGGPVYRGNKFSELDGHFVYGDYITGTIWALNTQDDGPVEYRTLADTDLHIVAFLQDSAGDIYLLDYDQTGQLYRMVKSEDVDHSAEFPRQLSKTGIFTSTESLAPAPGVVAYSVVAEPWMDGAKARRWVAIPRLGTIELAANNASVTTFPEGTVFIKQITLPQTDSYAERRLETQIMHFEKGTWRPYSYLWNEAGTDATLVDSAGLDHQLQLDDNPHSTRTWRVGSVNECRLCHSAGSGFVLGFTAEQLDRSAPSSVDQDAAQLDYLTKMNVLSKNYKSNNAQLLVDPHDSAADLTKRARSYLHVNCGVCHNRQGPATISFFAHIDYDFDDLRITKKPGIGSFGMESPRLIAAGDPFRSIVLYRMAKLGYGRMPYIGSRVVDSRGVGLIASWIAAMESTGTTSAPARDDTTEAQALKQLSTKSNDVVSVEHITELVQSTEGALALSTLIHQGSVNSADVDYVRQILPSLHGNLHGLFEQFIPEHQRRKTLGPNAEPDSILTLTGSAERGASIYLGDNARCRSCHDETNSKSSLGPTLAEIRSKLKRRNELLTHVLNPSLQIDDKFATWTVQTIDGIVYSGLLAASNDDNITIRQADKREITIKRNEIDELVRGTQSLMPSGVLSDLTAQEAADVLAFLLGGSGG